MESILLQFAMDVFVLWLRDTKHADVGGFRLSRVGVLSSAKLIEAEEWMAEIRSDVGGLRGDCSQFVSLHYRCQHDLFPVNTRR